MHRLHRRRLTAFIGALCIGFGCLLIAGVLVSRLERIAAFAPIEEPLAPDNPGTSDPRMVNFPRLATLYSKTDINTDAGKRAIARYQLYITDFGWWPDVNYSEGVPAGRSVGEYLKQLNPNLIAIIYQHGVLFEDGGWTWRANQTGYMADGVPLRIDFAWLLTYAGSTLQAPLTAEASTLQVADLTNFQVNDRVLIGSDPPREMVRITAKSGTRGPGTLTVVRGLNAQQGRFPATDHPAGSVVRTVAHAFGDQGVFVLNATANCPATLINPTLGPQTWNQFVATLLARKLAERHFTNLNGVFLDNFVDRAVEMVDDPQRVDYTTANSPGGLSDAAWQLGMTDLATSVRRALPADRLLIANTGGDPAVFAGSLNGGMIEGLDPSAQNALIRDTVQFYRGWNSGGRDPALTIINGSAPGSTLGTAQTNYQAMRFLLTWTLVHGEGYFAYDEFLVSNSSGNLNAGGHQTSWWFDEYDNAGQGTGYLGQPRGAGAEITPGVWRRDFDRGVVLMNGSTATATIALEQPFRKIRGKQAPEINDGQTATAVTLLPRDGMILLRESGS